MMKLGAFMAAGASTAYAKHCGAIKIKEDMEEKDLHIVSNGSCYHIEVDSKSV